jgi:4-hydroxymandelate oxidase
MPINLYEYEDAARPLIDPQDYDHIAGGATDEITLSRTREAYDSIELLPRVLRDVGVIDTATTLVGTPVQAPIILAPGSGHTRAHAEGELLTTRAAEAHGMIMTVSANSSYSLEDIAGAASTPLWCQFYIYRDRGRTLDWIARAEAVSCRALCITADAGSPPKRERDIRNRYRQNPEDGSIPPVEGASNINRIVVSRTARMKVDPSATWDDIAWLKSKTSLPVVVKGVMSPDDARKARQRGVDGIIVSNHGGRNLDTTVPTIKALPAVVDASGGAVEVFVDGGIRRGTDVIKALALGARAVLIGRPIYWGLAVGGEHGLERLLAILREEFEIAMAICGRPTLASLDPSLLARDM